MTDRPCVPRTCGLLGLLLFGCILMPLDGAGSPSVLATLWMLLQHNFVYGAIFAAIVMPFFGFGLLVAAHVFAPRVGNVHVLRWANNTLIAELLFIVVFVSSVGSEASVPWALLGVIGSALLARLGALLTEETLGPRFFVRWGALLIAASFTLLTLSTLRDGGSLDSFGIAVALLATAIVVVSRKRPSAPPTVPA